MCNLELFPLLYTLISECFRMKEHKIFTYRRFSSCEVLWREKARMKVRRCFFFSCKNNIDFRFRLNGSIVDVIQFVVNFFHSCGETLTTYFIFFSIGDLFVLFYKKKLPSVCAEIELSVLNDEYKEQVISEILGNRGIFYRNENKKIFTTL